MPASPGTGGGVWTDERHPAIKRMMHDYETTSGLGLRINLGQLLDAAKKEIRDLPVIPAYVDNGRPFVCWAHILGRCHFGSQCTFFRGHPPRHAIPDNFANDVVELLGGGVTAMVAARQARGGGGGSPPKQHKVENEAS